ncbi:hypothetical protein CAEBREN_28546 [Caenorhabditis brenneri]|uniref:Uncharacterized protein n=1 Tax=Caenorhabditis brenneri TaxID=135651 RepID=G0MTK1_CAEBE|nr:hypothetical protein CAEBREN_28546 [Caenorhabditis brenneri]
MSGDSKVWAHASADTWAAQTGISTYDLDTASIKREKIDCHEFRQRFPYLRFARTIAYIES